MPQQPIDYNALAEQARKQAAPTTPVDYAAMADQARQVNIGQNATFTANGVPIDPRADGAAPGVAGGKPYSAENFTPSQPAWYQTVANSLLDAAKGGKAGAMTTVYEGGDLVRRALGMPRIIDRPDVQAAMTAPNNTEGSIGKGLEQAAEYIVPLSRVSAATKGMGMLARMGAEGLASAGVAGAQSGGNAANMALAGTLGALAPPVGGLVGFTKAAAVRAAAGASEDGIGGAIAAAVRSAAPQEPQKLMVQALKPRNSNVFFSRNLSWSMPELKAAESALGKPIEGVEDLLAATKAAKQNIQDQLGRLRGPSQSMGAQVDLSKVADAMESSIPKTVRFESPDAASKLAEEAAIYRQKVPIQDAEQMLTETNAKLKSYYAKFPQAQRSALLADPGVAADEAKAKALRDAIYSTLDEPGQGTAARELNRRYGALLDVEQAAQSRANVAARQQPESLSEQIGSVRAASDMARGAWRIAHGDLTGAADIAAAHAGKAAGKAIKEAQTTDAMIKRAFANWKTSPAAITMPPQVQIRGLLESGSIRPPVPTDTSFVRAVPADYAQREYAGLLPSHTSISPTPPADTSFVRAVPGQYAQREMAGLLPAHQPSDPSFVRGSMAKFIDVRDPKTGKTMRIYLSQGR